MASPYASYVTRVPEGGYQWDLRRLASYEHHSGLYSTGIRVLFSVNELSRRFEAVRIDSELGSCTPQDGAWALSQRLALCALTNHVSLVRHFNWVHLAAGGSLAIATRNEFPPAHPLRRLLQPHMFRTQFSNQIVTKGQMAKGGDFESIFSFTHAGMCKLFEDSYEECDIGIFDPDRDAKRQGLSDASLDLPALANRVALFDVICAHTLHYLSLYYNDDARLRDDACFVAWVTSLDRLVPNGIRTVLGSDITVQGGARLMATFIYMVTVEHEIVGTGLWNYQMWPQIQPVRLYKDGRRLPLDVYQRLVNANFNLNIHRTQLLQDFSYLAIDAQGAEAFRQFRQSLLALQSRLEEERFAYWKIYPNILEANMNA